MNNFYLFISSNDSKNFHLENKSHTFTIELPERIELEDEWEVALVDLCTKNALDKNLYIYSDIADYSYVKSSLEPILRIIYPTVNSINYFSERYYIRVRQKTLGRIFLYIRDSEGQIPLNFDQEVTLTLHLKKKRKDGEIF